MLATDPALTPGATLSDQIAYRLQRDILERRIGLGDHLAQDELCARFGVSRTPIREALARLAASSLVELRPNRGAIVRRPGRREIRELYELRAELEGFAAERAAARADRPTLRRLDRLQADLTELLQERPSPDAQADDRSLFAAALGAANDAIHDLVLTVADNDALVQEVQRLRGRFPKDYVTEAAGEADELLALNVTEHEEILAALADGDGARARRAMTDHVAHAATLLTEHLARERFWE
jgi:DNA-binding GntR family transcriptional regulator